MTRVTLYSKPGCHLCDQAKEIIERVKRDRAFEFHIRNITDDASDFARFQFAIPVIEIDGQEIARYRLTEAQLRAELESRTPRDSRI